MLTPPFKQHLSREFGAEERYHIYQRLIPIHQPSATDPHGLPEKSAKTQNASEKKGMWREKTCFRQDFQHHKFWNNICMSERMNPESQVKWQGMHGTLPPKKMHFIGGGPTRCLMRIATVQRSSCKSRTPKKKFPTSMSATCSEDTKTRDVKRHDIYIYILYILYIYIPNCLTRHHHIVYSLEDMSDVLIFHLGCQTASRGHQGGQGTACRRKRRRRSRSCCWVSVGSRTRRMR